MANKHTDHGSPFVAESATGDLRRVWPQVKQAWAQTCHLLTTVETAILVYLLEPKAKDSDNYRIQCSQGAPGCSGGITG